MGGGQGGEAEVGTDLGLQLDDPEPSGGGGEPDLTGLGQVADVSPRLVQHGGPGRVPHGAGVEVGDLLGMVGVAQVGDPEAGVPHRQHGEGGVGRVVNVVVVDAGVDLIGHLGGAVGLVVD